MILGTLDASLAAPGAEAGACAPVDPASPIPALFPPVEGMVAATLVDGFDQRRAGHRHEAIDIPAARGTPVRAVDEGTVAKLFLSKPGGRTLYHFDPRGRLAYYYAHLDAYAPGLPVGAPLRRGQVIGYVGSTGSASPDAPHLHFAVFELGAKRQWWAGKALNPYAALRAGAGCAAAAGDATAPMRR